MTSTKKTARIAGRLYLVNGITGYFSIVYVLRRLIVSGNAVATAANILGSQRLFRLGIAAEVICGSGVYLPALGSVPITQRGEQDACFADGDMGSGFRAHYVHECCQRHRRLYVLPLARTSCRYSTSHNANPWAFCSSMCVAMATKSAGSSASSFFTSAFVYGGRASCHVSLASCSWLHVSATWETALRHWLLPSYEDAVARIANVPLTLGEPAIILWLLIMGAKTQPLEAPPDCIYLGDKSIPLGWFRRDSRGFRASNVRPVPRTGRRSAGHLRPLEMPFCATVRPTLQALERFPHIFLVAIIVRVYRD